MNVLLKIISEKSAERVERSLSEGVYKIGRSDLCDIVLEGKDVSRSHVELRITQTSVYATNISNSGILRLNGDRVETCEVKETDELEFGNYKVTFVVEVELNQVREAQSFEVDHPNLELESPEQNFINQNIQSERQQEFRREFPIAEMEDLAESSPVEGALALKTENTDLDNQAVVAKIIFTEGPLSGSEIPLQGYEINMGRSRKADIYIPDDKLSRKHAKISRVGMGYRLIDLDSRNGTYVNGVRVLEHPLSSFDVIEIGKSKMRFLILDMNLGGIEKGGALRVIDGGAPTKTFQLAPQSLAENREQPKPQSELGTDQLPSPHLGSVHGQPSESKKENRAKKKNILYAILLATLIGVYFNLPSDKPSSSTDDKNTSEEVKIESTSSAEQTSEGLLPPIPREFSELSQENQIKVEGHYNTAQRYQEREDFVNALNELRALHLILPYYKESKRFEKFYENKVLAKQKVEAAERARRDREADIRLYIEEGVEYLSQSNFKRAGEAFGQVLLLDPQNDTARKGIRAAELQVTDISQLPPEVDPEFEKKKLVAQLLEKAQAKYEEKSYQEAINFAEQVRSIEIVGETEYLNEAKQIIDRSRILQKEEFEPFLIQAKEKFAEGDYNLSRDLCDEMLKRDPSYDAAQECSIRARKQLNRLAKEAYTHGYILESMNRIEEAKQYWNRAKNYARPGDPYYDKIQRKLDNYQ